MSFDPAVERQKGLDAYVFFQNAAGNYPQNYTFSFDDAKNYIDNQSPQFFELLGKTILEANVDDSVVQVRMTSLANNNQGTLPSHLSEFLKAFGDPNVHEWSWTDSVKAVLQGTEDAVSTIATNVENFSTATVSNVASGVVTLTKYLPIIAVGALAFFLFLESGRSLSLKGIAK